MTLTGWSCFSIDGILRRSILAVSPGLRGCSTLLTSPVAFSIGPVQRDVDRVASTAICSLTTCGRSDARLLPVSASVPLSTTYRAAAAVAVMLAVRRTAPPARTARRRSRSCPASARRRASPTVPARSTSAPRSRNCDVAGERARASAPCPARPVPSSVRARIVRAGAPGSGGKRQLHASRGRSAPSASRRPAPARCRSCSAAICRPGWPRLAGELDRRVAGDQRVLERLAVGARTSDRCRGRSAPAGRRRRPSRPVIRELPRSSSASIRSSSALRCATPLSASIDLAAARRLHAALEADVLVAARERRRCPT